MHSLALALIIITLVVTISLVIRIDVLFKSASSVDFTVLNLMVIFGFGLCYDLCNALYFILLLMLYIWPMPAKLHAKTLAVDFTL